MSKVQRYLNLNGDSNVNAYEISIDQIDVQFGDGSVYRYTRTSCGSANLERMKSLAIAGRGLNSFINTTVRKMYASKMR